MRGKVTPEQHCANYGHEWEAWGGWHKSGPTFVVCRRCGRRDRLTSEQSADYLLSLHGVSPSAFHWQMQRVIARDERAAKQAKSEAEQSAAKLLKRATYGGDYGADYGAMGSDE